MNFSGDKRATFDEKGRVVLPAEFKNEMGGKIPGGQMAIEKDPYEKCLNVYPIEVWEERLAGLTAKLNRNNRRQSKLFDMIYQSFKIISVPENCRMNFPNSFLEEVGINKDVVFVGSFDRIRLWDVDNYNTYNSKEENYGDMFAEFFGDEGEE